MWKRNFTTDFYVSGTANVLKAFILLGGILLLRHNFVFVQCPLMAGSPFFGILMLPCRIGDGKWHKFQEREEAEGEGAVEAEDEDEGSQAGASPVGQSLRLMEPATDLGWMPMTKRKGGKCVSLSIVIYLIFGCELLSAESEKS